MVHTKTIILGFLAVLAGYLIFRQSLWMQYLTTTQVAVTAAAVLFAFVDARIRGCPLGRLHAPKEEKDLRLFLFGKNTAFLCGIVLAALCALSLLPNSSFCWNIGEKLTVNGLPMPLTRPQIRVLEHFISEYERCVTAEQRTAFLQAIRQQGPQSVALWTAALGYTKNAQLKRDLLPLLQEVTGLPVSAVNDADEKAVAEAVAHLLRWQIEHQPITPVVPVAPVTSVTPVTPVAPVAPVAPVEAPRGSAEFR